MTRKVVHMPNQDPQDQLSTPSGATAPSSGQAAAVPRRPWHDRLSDLARWLGGPLRSPRTRLCLVGVILLLVGALWITGSVWTLPLIVVGIVMVMIAWVGSRLDGRFAVEWGEGGTKLEFRAQIKPSPPAAQPAHVSTIPPAAPQMRTPQRPRLDDGTVIEGEGHTVEIDVAELKTLIAAAEAREASAATEAGRGEAAPGSSERRPAA